MLRAFFVHLSENRSLRNFAERSSIGRRVSGRFVAGTEIADAVRVTQAVNRAGMSVSIDNLGENVTNPDEARHSAELYQQILDAIAANGLNANISLKLTHMGLDVDEKLARDIVSGLVATGRVDESAGIRAGRYGRLSVHAAHARLRARIASHAGKREQRGHRDSGVPEALRKRRGKTAVGRDSDPLVQRCLQGAGKYCIREQSRRGRQLHQADEDPDEERHLSRPGHARRKHHSRGPGVRHAARRFRPTSFEFQMLYGIRRDLQQSLVRDGWRMRVYVPFGTEWYPYFMRRLGERPANVFFIARNMLRS